MDYSIGDLGAGNHSVVAVYLGDDTHDANYAYESFSIVEKPTPEPIAPNVEITVPSDVKVGDDASVEIKIANATGNVSVIVDGNEITVALDENGIANVPINDISAGNHSVVVIYAGDENNAPVHDVSSFNVEAEPVVEKLGTEFVNIVVEDNLVITATLVDSIGNAIKNANVICIVGNETKSVVTNDKGEFTVNGVYNKEIIFSYAGDDDYRGINTSMTFKEVTPIVPQRIATKFNITDNSITLYGYAVDEKAGERGKTYATELLDADGKPISNVLVQFAVNNKIYNRTTFENGSFNPYHLDMVRAGRYTLAFSFGGNDKYNSTFAVVCIDLDKKPIKIKASAKTYKASAKTKKYTVTLSTIVGSSLDGKVHMRTGLKVTMKINGKTYNAKTNSKGQATFNLKLTKKGKYNAEISYKGDITYESATKNVKLTIK